MQIITSTDLNEMSQKVADYIIDSALDAVSRKDRFNLVLSGGSTPLPMYRLLAKEPRLQAMPWQKTHIFWGDERMLPAQDLDSNYGAAYVEMIKHTPLPPANLHPIRGDLAPVDAAENYEERLRRIFGEVELPVFDLVLLGLGPDGHIASLFPRTSALKEARHWAVEVPRPKEMFPQVPRVSLTLPVLGAAEKVLLMVAGERKARIVADIIRGDMAENEDYPAARLKPRGEFIWHLDEGAASHLG